MLRNLGRYVHLAFWAATWNSPRLRRLIAPIGLHVDQIWLEGGRGNVRLYNGRRILLTHVHHNWLTFELHWKSWRYYEPISILLLGELVKTADVFYDIGANIGYYALCAAVLRPDLGIAAFEPNTRMFGIMSDNVRANQFDIRCEQIAVSDKTGIQPFYISNSDMSSSLKPEFRPLQGQTPKSIPIETMTLDDYVAKHAPNGRLLIKVDVEGHERNLLFGAAATIKDRKPDIILEVTEPFDAETVSLLRDSGYCFYKVMDTGFYKVDTLDLNVTRGLLFLNYLISARPQSEIDGFHKSIEPEIKRINLYRTSKRHARAHSA